MFQGKQQDKVVLPARVQVVPQQAIDSLAKRQSDALEAMRSKSLIYAHPLRHVKLRS